ncbi:MAG: hypothetical protein IPF99_14805 [Deltaproteobacteria bacterium]|nr:hypothetical protein [Deltaproteobacteria bacterium]
MSRDPSSAPQHVFRWDLDKTYLHTEFDHWLDLLKTAVETPETKRSVPGAARLIRALRLHQPSRVTILSGSPEQMRGALESKLRLDGIAWDEFTLKPSLRNIMRLRFRALRDQVGYKLPALLSARTRTPPDLPETLFGDDAEADALVYSLYADVLAGKVSDRQLTAVLEQSRTYADVVSEIIRWCTAPPAGTSRRASSAAARAAATRASSESTAAAWCPSPTTSRPPRCWSPTGSARPPTCSPPSPSPPSPPPPRCTPGETQLPVPEIAESLHALVRRGRQSSGRPGAPQSARRRASSRPPRLKTASSTTSTPTCQRTRRPLPAIARAIDEVAIGRPPRRLADDRRPLGGRVDAATGAGRSPSPVVGSSVGRGFASCRPP